MSGNMPGRNVLQLLNDLRKAQQDLHEATEIYSKALDASMTSIQQINEELAAGFGFTLGRSPEPDTGGEIRGNGSVLLT